MPSRMLSDLISLPNIKSVCQQTCLSLPVYDLIFVKMTDPLEDLFSNRSYLSFSEDGVEHHVCECSSLHELHHHHQVVPLKVQLNIIDKIGVVEVSHYNDFSQELVLSLMIRDVDILDGELQIIWSKERSDEDDFLPHSLMTSVWL